MINYPALGKEDAKKELESFTQLKINCPDDLRKLPLESGIYAVIHTHTGRVFYIGKSVKIRSRWYSKAIDVLPEEYRNESKGQLVNSTWSHFDDTIILRKMRLASQTTNRERVTAANLNNGHSFYHTHKMLYHVLELGCHISYKLYPKLEATHLELDLINAINPPYNICKV